MKYESKNMALIIRIKKGMLVGRTPSDENFHQMASQVRSPYENSVHFYGINGTQMVRQISDSTEWDPGERISCFGRNTNTKITGDYPKSQTRNLGYSFKAEEASRIWAMNGYKN